MASDMYPHSSHHCSLQRVPLCRRTPNEAVSLEHLKKLGVLYWRLKGEEDPKLAAIREARGYSYKVPWLERSPSALLDPCNSIQTDHI